MPVPDDGNGLLQLNLPATFYLNINKRLVIGEQS